jgi:hypothetical protein
MPKIGFVPEWRALEKGAQWRVDGMLQWADFTL